MAKKKRRNEKAGKRQERKKFQSKPKLEAKYLLDRKTEFNTERDIAMNFAIRVQKRFDRMIKAIVLFGSQAKNQATPNSDIDIIILIDDASIKWDPELIAWYREELVKLIQDVDYGKELHVNTIKLTTWWNDLIYGDPIVINIIRYGEVLIDVGGFFSPLKALLKEGKIRSTHEAVYVSLERAPGHLLRSKMSKIGAIEGVFWCMVDSAQAALMTIGKLPPSTEHIPSMLKEAFVDKGLLKASYVDALRNLYNLHKGISHGVINEVPGKEIDEWQKIAESFLNEMAKIINQIISIQKK